MAKKTYPEGYKAKDVALDKMEGTGESAAPVRVLYMKDETVWHELAPNTFTKVEAVKQPSPDNPAASDDGDKTVDGVVTKEEDESVEHIKAQLAEKSAQLDAAKNQIDALSSGHNRGKHEGRAGRGQTLASLPKAEVKMAGKWPHSLDDMPTVDEINKAGQG